MSSAYRIVGRHVVDVVLVFLCPFPGRHHIPIRASIGPRNPWYVWLGLDAPRSSRFAFGTPLLPEDYTGDGQRCEVCGSTYSYERRPRVDDNSLVCSL
jgi:hypothetical protein